MSAMLEVHKLTAGYRRPVIRDISFTLRPGEVTAVLGRNGCGKTTLLRSLTGGARILSGAVQAMGEDCLAWSARRRARTIALLSQHSQLLPGLRAEEVIAMGRTPWLGPLSGLGPEERAMVRRRRSASAWRSFWAGTVPSSVRDSASWSTWPVWPSRTPPSCCWMSPTAPWTLTTPACCSTGCRELVETGERTALIVLHDPALALRWCGRLLLLDGGRLVEDVATEGMGPEALQAVLGRLYPTIQVRRDEGGRFYCLPD